MVTSQKLKFKKNKCQNIDSPWWSAEKNVFALVSLKIVRLGLVLKKVILKKIHSPPHIKWFTPVPNNSPGKK